MLVAIDTALRAMFPSRAATEALLDLAERKGWTDADRAEAMASFFAFLSEDLGLPATLAGTDASAPDLGRLRAAIDTIDARPAAGVAAWIVAVASAAGTTAKTLANSRPSAPTGARADHRWLVWLGRTLDQPPAPDVWTYAHRTRAGSAAWMGRWRPGHVWDAADALLLVSLVALWQRRRPVAAIRGQRGRPGSRRGAPKPVVRLAHSLCQAGQVPALAALLIGLHGGVDAAPFLDMVLESALTSGHLHMHPDRRGGTPVTAEGLLRSVEAELGRSRIEAPASASWRWRVERMRAWQQRREATAPPPELDRDAYAQWSWWLERQRRTPDLPPPVGLAVPWMLEPHVRSAVRGKA